jgi:sarcosine oxidase subunit beta
MNQFVTSPKRSRQSADLLIVGAGVIGASVAVAASRAGLAVTVVDRGSRAGFGSTSSSAGIVRVHAFDRESCVLADESVSAWESWREFTETPGTDAVARFVRCGSYIFDDGSDAVERLAEVMRDSGVTYSELDAEGLASALPWMDTRRFGPPALPESVEFWQEPGALLPGGLFTPSSGYVADPALAAQNLADQAVRLGAELRLGVAVTGFSSLAGGVTRVELADGDHIDAAAVLNAAGPHSSRITELAAAGGDFGVTLGRVRQELHSFPLPPGVTDPAHIVDGDLGINFRPAGDEGVLVGGNGAAVDPVEIVEDPDRFREQPTRDAFQRHAARLALRVPGVEIPHRPVGIAGLYDVTDDWLPVYDRTERDGFFVAVGTSGNQFKTAPVVGGLMTEVIVAGLQGIDTDADPVVHRFSGSGREVALSAFSRRRVPQTGGSRG